MQSSRCDTYRRRRSNESDEKRFVLSFVDATDAIVGLLIYVCVIRDASYPSPVPCTLHSTKKQSQPRRIIE